MASVFYQDIMPSAFAIIYFKFEWGSFLLCKAKEMNKMSKRKTDARRVNENDYFQSARLQCIGFEDSFKSNSFGCYGYVKLWVRLGQTVLTE